MGEKGCVYVCVWLDVTPLFLPVLFSINLVLQMLLFCLQKPYHFLDIS